MREVGSSPVCRLRLFVATRGGSPPGARPISISTKSSTGNCVTWAFLPLCHCPGTTFSAFYGVETLQRPAVYDRAIATANARLSAQIPVILNVCRFAHYLKVIARDRIGTFLEPRELELILQRWLTRYVSANEDSGADPVPRYPLREALVMVRERPDKPGSFVCVLHLRPRLQEETMTATLRLTTELADHLSLQAVG